MREAIEILKNDDKLLKLWIYSVENTSVELIDGFSVYCDIPIYD